MLDINLKTESHLHPNKQEAPTWTVTGSFYAVVVNPRDSLEQTVDSVPVSCGNPDVFYDAG